VTVGADWSIMFSRPLDDSRGGRIADRYGVTAILEQTVTPAVYYTGWGAIYESPLLTDIYTERYKLYDSGGVRIWFL